MDATLNALGGILLRAVPTFIIVILLNFYLKIIFFKPFDEVLRKRYEATEGARELAKRSAERAAAKAAEYEAAMRAARAEVYQALEQSHKRLEERHAADLAAARQRTEAVVREAKLQLAAEAEAAKGLLARDAEALSDEIARALLSRSAA